LVEFFSREEAKMPNMGYRKSVDHTIKVSLKRIEGLSRVPHYKTKKISI